MWKTLAAVSLLNLLSACGAPPSPKAPAPRQSPAESVVRPAGDAPPRIDLSGCPDECSGHDAGYAWAQSQRIEGYHQCQGPDPGFLEGCTAYVHDRHEEQENEEEQSYQSPAPPR